MKRVLLYFHTIYFFCGFCLFSHSQQSYPWFSYLPLGVALHYPLLLLHRAPNNSAHRNRKTISNPRSAGRFCNRPLTVLEVVVPWSTWKTWIPKMYVLFSAELKPRGYYLEHVLYLDLVIFTYIRHVYYLTIDFYNEPWVLFG